MTTVAAAPAAHELLLRLAGRVPDELLWRLRDWVAAGDDEAIGAVLPRTLLRHRIGLTDDERELLSAVVPSGSASHRLVGAVLAGAEPVPPSFGPGEPDLAAWSALSVLRDDARELLLAVRGDGARVVLVRGAERPHLLTAGLQRLLRVHGERVPKVEVWAGDRSPSPYHEAACAAAASLWNRPPVPTG
ncbi:hypothetical protein Ae168Ps1_3242 [Pseudonocardia sp. Ae168_Ps1]|uniref:hypothetical protein n=1 Tax=unclassified Pseudonocardia TaxID=2619320 RepID=UPI00094B58D2|nr:MULTISPECIES: hypothetical protein [unclassified Pseudonocardia]OLL74844.1 hypothetical protein Ae150APs1_3222 [Pseudonocardia sp. Ae150A_Ps1]OLL80836.1 hypothetical protein Ae168Ps1_3242 [Pseudonocardia sp. Ae168_Ps1]OLL85046.1 hypothetical protein Ae263Ps1_2101c [Pseudonocardia sp. Ae263_Ps1]OLL94937.1 hypothetical protein Ae356Ps1_4834 [Pseudonocardia sp. Ae356_Ps1]